MNLSNTINRLICSHTSKRKPFEKRKEREDVVIADKGDVTCHGMVPLRLQDYHHGSEHRAVCYLQPSP